MHINIINPPTCRSSKWPLSLRSPHRNSVYISPLPHARYMPRPSHSSRFYHPNNIAWGVQIIKILITQFTPLPFYLVPLRPKDSPQHPILNHPQSTFHPPCERPSFTPIQNDRQNYSISKSLNLWIANWKTKDSLTSVSESTHCNENS